MNRTDFVLAVLSAADGAEHTPVQVQKLFFLLDRKVSHLTGGPHFDFAAYDYGPFDASVYGELRKLGAGGLVSIETVSDSPVRKYRPTEAGLARGRRLLGSLPDGAEGYIRQLSVWVRRQSFASLVSAIYKEYPEMRANSVFRY